MIAPPPPKIPGYPWLLKLWPFTIVALWPLWLFAILTGRTTLSIATEAWFVGFALGRAVWEIISMRRDETRWRQIEEEYRRFWLRRHGS